MPHPAGGEGRLFATEEGAPGKGVGGRAPGVGSRKTTGLSEVSLGKQSGINHLKSCLGAESLL